MIHWHRYLIIAIFFNFAGFLQAEPDPALANPVPANPTDAPPAMPPPPPPPMMNADSESPDAMNGDPVNNAAVEPVPNDVGTNIPTMDGGSNEGDAPEVESAASAGGVKKIPTEKSGKKQTRFKEDDDGMVNIDFPEPTDLNDVIKAVSNWTDKNIVLGRGVSGKVQIITPTKVSRKDAYEIFLSALAVSGYTTVEEGKVLKIVSRSNAMKDNLKTYKGETFPKTAQVISRVIPLKYVDAKQVVSTLTPFITRSEMVAYEPTNTLILSTTGHKVEQVLDIISLLDVRTEKPIFKMIPVKYADVKDVANKVKEIYMGSGAAKITAASSKRDGMGIQKIMTDERTNSIIYLGNEKSLDAVRKVIQQLDTAVENPTSQTIHVHPLEYADAEKLSGILSNLASGTSKRNTARRTFNDPTMVNPMDGSNNIPQAPSVADFGDMKIAAEPMTNSLIITGSKVAYDSIVNIINKIDIRKPQVYIEADILDITLQDGLGFGTSLVAGEKNMMGKDGINGVYGFNAQDSVGIASLGNTSTTSTASALSSAASATSLLQNAVLAVLGGQKYNFMGTDIYTPTALITALKTNSNTNVLSSPSILTSDNEEALIEVGQKVSFLKFQSTNAEGRAINSAEFEDVALALTVKPKISQNDSVTLTLNLKNDELGAKAINGQPSINKRSTKTAVTVDNHQTIIISGLSRDFESIGKNKIPLLGDIPILGWLFSKSSIDKQKSFLMVFLTPHIVREPADMAAIYESKIKDRDQFLKSAYGRDYQVNSIYKALPKLEDGQPRPKPNGTKASVEADKQAALDKKKIDEKKKHDNDKYKSEDDIEIPSMENAGSSGNFSSQMDSGAISAEPPLPPPPSMPEDMGTVDEAPVFEENN